MQWDSEELWLVPPVCCKQRFGWLWPDRILFLAICCHRTAEFPDILYDVSHSVRFPIRCSLLLWKEHSEIQRFVRVKISVISADERCIVFNLFSIFNNQIPINNLRKFISFTFSIRSIHPSIYLLVHPSSHACMHPSIHLSHCTSIQMNTRTSNYQFIYPFQDWSQNHLYGLPSSDGKRKKLTHLNQFLLNTTLKKTKTLTGKQNFRITSTETTHLFLQDKPPCRKKIKLFFFF